MKHSTAVDLLKPWGKRQSLFANALCHWYQTNRKDWPWRKRFAESNDPYAVWVSEIMLQQTTIQAVLPAYERFMTIFPKVYHLAHADEESVRIACRGLGYYRRFRMMGEAAKVLTKSLKSPEDTVSWPKTFDAWKELPGIGDYTAAAISSIAFAYPKAVVDGNVERVFSRLFNLEIIPDQKWKKIFQAVGDELVPRTHNGPSDFNQGLMELGQTVCTKGVPRCSQCPVADFCAAEKAGTQSSVPLNKPKMEMLDVRMAIFIQEKRGRVGLLKRRADAKFLAGTLSFPSCINLGNDKFRWETGEIKREGSHRLGAVKHSITKHKIEAEVYLLPDAEDSKDMKWLSREELEENLVSNLDRKAWLLYQKSLGKAPLEHLLR